MDNKNVDRFAVKAGFWFAVSNIVQRGIQFLYTPIYSRLLSTDGYGKYSTFLAWESILAVFATLNLSNAVFNKGMVKYEDDDDAFAYSMYGLSFFSTILTGGVCSILFLFLDPSLRLSIEEYILLFVVMYFKMAIQIWSSGERYHFRYKALLIVTVLSSLLNPLLSVLLFYFRQDYRSVELGYVLSMLLVGIVLIVLSKKQKTHFYNKEYWHYALMFVLPLIPHYLSNVILYQSDRLMIGYYCDDASVGIYTLAYQLALATTVVFTAVNNALVPWLYRKIKGDDYSSIARVIYAMIGIVFIASLSLIIVAPELIFVLGSEAFMSAVSLVSPIVISTLLMFVNTLILDVLFYYEKNKSIMVATVIGAITNLVLNAFLIPRVGFEIAAYTTVIGYAVILIINYIDLLILKTPFLYIDKKSGLLVIIGTTICFLAQMLFKIHSIARWIIALILCFGSLYIFYKRYYVKLKMDKGDEQA